MEKEKVKEILKKRIENINPWETHALEYHKGLLDLINELEQENERLLNFNNTLMQEKQKILQSKVVENWYNDLKKEIGNFADLLKNKAKENKQNWVNNNDKNSKDLLESVSIKDIEEILHNWYFKKGE